MPFPVLGSNSAVAGGYEIDNSLRFNPSDSAYLTKTPSSTGNRRTWTFSCWFKLSNVGTDTFSLFTTKYVNGDNTDIVVSSNKIQVYSISTSGIDFQYATSGLFRDVSAWYHIVVAVDTTQGTDSNRVKIYINGSQVTSFSTTNHPNQNFDTFQNLSGEPTYIGASDVNVLSPAITRFFDGYLSEIYMIDGTQYTASDFGEYNDNGVWIPKEYEGTYGTNGFKLEFQDSGALGTDTSGNGNDFTATNLTATDQTTDTPTNNFCTMNPLDNFYASGVFAEGNLDLTTNASAYAFNSSTFGLDSGKWYWEAKVTEIGTGTDNWLLGITASPSVSASEMLGQHNYSLSYRNNGNYKTSDVNNTHGASFTNNDIVMFALDLDNDRLYLGHGGSWADGSGNTDESDLSNPDSIIDISGLRSTSKGTTVFIAFGDGNGNAVSTPSEAQLNFGNPPFTISSGNSDGAGFGNFEYEPPSGYYALCTKNLAEYG